LNTSINPALVPSQTTFTGAKIPSVGLGTFGSDKYSPKEIAQAVEDAIQQGYRHVDCASVYGNEAEIGVALRSAMSAGVKRDEIWITSKVWNNMHGQVVRSCQKTLEDLQLDYVDLFLVHWPFPNHHEKGVSVNSRDPHAVPYIHENFMRTWRQMEQLVEMGLARHIGVSNVTIPKLKLILRDAKIKPAACEMELHPHFQQPELFDFVKASGIVPIGYSPIGSPSRPERDRTAGDTVDTTDPVIVDIAKRLNVHPALVCIKWAAQKGAVPIPFSVKPAQYLENLRCVTTAPLSDADMLAISKIDKNCRLIKGQVFLWPGAKDWQDLWDMDGEIAGNPPPAERG